MYVSTCYRCPERHPEWKPAEGKYNRRKRCPILQGKLDLIKGAGLTKIEFKCEKRRQLFQPGEVVKFQLWSNYAWGGVKKTHIGIIMRPHDERKYLVYCEETNFPVVKLFPEFQRTGERVRVCVHCGKPEGKEIMMPQEQGGKDKPWTCRYSDTFDEALNDFQALPCEYEQGAREVVTGEGE